MISDIDSMSNKFAQAFIPFIEFIPHNRLISEVKLYHFTICVELFGSIIEKNTFLKSRSGFLLFIHLAAFGGPQRLGHIRQV